MAETLFYYQVNAIINWLVIIVLIIYGLQCIFMIFLTLFLKIRNKILRNCWRGSLTNYDGYETNEDLVYDKDE